MKLLFGCGYLGSRVAKLWNEAGDDVTVVTRSSAKAAELRRDGLKAIVADVTDTTSITDLPDAETILYAVGFDRRNGQSIADVQTGGVSNVLDALSGRCTRLIHVSTTGVYGTSRGAWIDERTAPAPERDGGKASLASELAIAGHPLGRNAIILRLAGIYGPDRIPFLRQLKAGEPIAAPRHGYLNLIHVEDAARCVLVAERLPPDGRDPLILNVCDGQPVVREEFYCEVASRIGARPPRFTTPSPDSTRAARARGDKRIRNDEMLAKLRVDLSYPSYREGLASILEGADNR